MKVDYFIFYANMFGVILGMFYTMSALSILYGSKQTAEVKMYYNGLEGLLLVGTLMWLIVFSVVCMDMVGNRIRAIQIIGYIGLHTISYSAYAVDFYLLTLSIPDA